MLGISLQLQQPSWTTQQTAQQTAPRELIWWDWERVRLLVDDLPLPLSPSLRARQRPDPYQGISSSPFPPEVVEVLTARLGEEDVEIKLDGLLFLPEIKYRRTLNRAFGPGGWALMPMGDILHFQVTAASPSPLATVQFGAA